MDPNQQPTQTPTPVPTPTPTGPTTSPVEQPAASSLTKGGVQALTPEAIAKQKKIGWTVGILSLVGLVIGLLFGFALAAGALLGAYALYLGIRLKVTGLKVIGGIGLALNFILYTLAIVLS